MEQINDEPEIQIPENEEDVQMEQIHDEPLENNVAQEEERLMDLADINAPLVGDILIADDPLQPEAGPANEELPEFNPNLRRSRRNLYPKHSKKMKQLLGLPTSDDEGYVTVDQALSAVHMDHAINAMMWDHDPSEPFSPPSVFDKNDIAIDQAMVAMILDSDLSKKFQPTSVPQIEPYIPINYKDAISCPEAIFWIPAIKDEFKSLIQIPTWVLVPKLSGRKGIKCKWVLDYKPGYKGVDPRYKARLVACGYAQLYGIDYLDTYAPVVKHHSIKLVLAIAALKDLDLMQIDIKTAFLNGDLTEEIFMEQPEGFVVAGKEDWLCRLVKRIYGLKQAARCWFIKFNQAIITLGFVQCLHDQCVYYRFTKNGEYTIIIIYVDDGLICSNVSGVFIEIVNHLKKQFDVRSLPANRFVGIDISRNREKRTLSLSQPTFARSILSRFGMNDCNPMSIPAKPDRRLTPEMSPKTEDDRNYMANVPYRECIGSLMYLMAMTRPDIALALNQAAAYVSNPGREHWDAVLQILCYIKKTIHYGLVYGDCSNSTLLGFTDADWAGDLQTRKSTTGILFTFNGGPVAYGSRRQRATALSTRDSEFYAVCEGAKESIWLKSLLLELGIDVGRVSIRCDSKCAIALVSGQETHKARHIDVRYFFSREQKEMGNILVTFIRGKDQPADLFTKALPDVPFKKYRDEMGVKEIQN